MFTVNYDSKYDVMYISIGQPVPSISDEDDDGIVTRFAIDTGKISGITIMGFKRKLEKGFFEHYNSPIGIDFFNPALLGLLSSSPEKYRAII
jgi:uncharacterized protein YuzE